MKTKTICFCIRVRNQKSKENELGDSEQLSESARRKSRNPKSKRGRWYASASLDGGADGNAPGATTTAGNDAAVTAAVVAAVQMSAITASVGGSSQGGDSAGGGGGGG